MSDTNFEPMSKRLRNRSGQNVPSTGESTSNKTNEPHEQSQKKQATEQSNSMYGLSDECLEKFFERLNFESFCQMANVCKRFRQIADKIFALKHNELKLEGRCTNSTFRRVLLKFGHLITSIDTTEAYFDDDMDTDAMVKYCPTKLEKLSLRHSKIKCAAFKPLFVRMKELILDGCEFIGEKQTLFTGCSALEYLFFDSNEDSCDFVAQKYPKLSGLAFDPNFSSFNTFFQLLRLNPQLENLHIMTMAEDIYISSVVQHTKNLERLVIVQGMMSSTPEIQTKNVFLQLAKLKKLKKLTLAAGWEIYAKLVAPLMDAFAKGSIALDELELRDFEIGSKEIKRIANLKTLEVLTLDSIKAGFSSADLLSLSKLPLLTNLILYFGYKSKNPVSLDALTKMMMEATRLSCVALVGIRNLKIGQKEFEQLLKSIQGQSDDDKAITIQIFGCRTTTSFDVPQNVQQMYMKQLRILYESDDDDQCECNSCDE